MGRDRVSRSRPSHDVKLLGPGSYGAGGLGPRKTTSGARFVGKAYVSTKHLDDASAVGPGSYNPVLSGLRPEFGADDHKMSSTFMGSTGSDPSHRVAEIMPDLHRLPPRLLLLPLRGSPRRRGVVGRRYETSMSRRSMHVRTIMCIMASHVRMYARVRGDRRRSCAARFRANPRHVTLPTPPHGAECLSHARAGLGGRVAMQRKSLLLQYLLTY